MDQENLLALSWKIATEPKLYRELAPNPYAPHALQIISERFPDANSADIIKAVVLAEPGRKYDWDFMQLPKEQQEEELLKQRALIAGIYKRLNQHCAKHKKNLSRFSRERVYEQLFLTVFGTADTKEIEQRYAHSHRRDLKLSIVNFIEFSCVVRPKKKISPFDKVLFVTIAILSFLLFFYLFQRQYEITLQHQKALKQTLALEAQRENPGFPVRLKIPSISVDAAIEYMSVTPKGAMDVPNNTFDVGWFSLGPRPGENGSAVIAGHFDGKDGESGVFKDLNKLKAGDKLSITYSRGKSVTFAVRESQTYDPGYAEEVFSRSDTAHLNLVTCDGIWNGVKKSYSKRLVVFSDMVR